MIEDGNSIAIELKSNIISRVIRSIENNDFQISDRSKNKIFMRRFRLNHSSVKNILLSLNHTSIVKIDEDHHELEFGEEPIIICKVRKTLINFHGESEEVTIYIKLKLFEDKIIPVISFHKDEF